MIIIPWLIVFFIASYVICFFEMGLKIWSIVLALMLGFLTVYYKYSMAILIIDKIFIVLAILFNIKAIRRQVISRFIFLIAKKSIPTLSKTESEALNAGNISFEGEFFKGKPSFKYLLSLKPPELSKKEQEFLDGPTEQLCAMLDDYKIYEDKDLPPKVWGFIKNQGFLGIIIPKEYGGKEFSAALHSAVIMKIGSRNLVAAISVGVPNSLGPAELLVRYGTKEQKEYYLPRLARGEEIPCFALTGPLAGSDAASIPDFGIVCYEEFEGKKTLGIRLNWDKRYITLAPIATLIGLAFKLRDPEHLLSGEEDRGITCALIPKDLPGIKIGQRHMPFDIMFQNGPTQGKDVFIPLDYIIGGPKQIGKGWRMLMECLSAGRAITLPSSGSASAMAAAVFSGCYARVRHQFGIYIGRFAGVQELLARIAANAYINLSALRFAVARIDEGTQPSVLSAIVKYHTTERSRQAVNDAMDIHGGKGICLGPKNYLANLYRSAPINITVEGANILTRNMIIFGQGSIRCHPYLLKEMNAVKNNNLKSFDELIFSHLGFLFRNFARAYFHGITNGLFVVVPDGMTKRHFQKVMRYSAAFALVADIICATMGATLKRKENLSAKLGDILSYLFLASATLKRFYDDGQNKEDLPLVNYACNWLFYDIENRFKEILNNLSNRLLAYYLYFVCFPCGLRQKMPSDKLTEEVAGLLLSPTASLNRLSEGLYKTAAPDNFLALLQEAQMKTLNAEELEKRVRKAQKEGLIYGLHQEDLIKEAREKSVINDQEYVQLLEVVKLRSEIIAVDAFDI